MDKDSIDVERFCDDFINITNESYGKFLGAEREVFLAIIGAMVYIRYVSGSYDLSAFIAFVTKTRLYASKSLEIGHVIDSFYAYMKHQKKKIFISMPFQKYACDYHLKTVMEVIETINNEYKEEFLNEKLECIKVDENDNGGTFEINQRIINEISNCGCMIADLTYNNPNVFHEVGILMGRTYADKGRPDKFNMILLCDENELPVKEVKFSLRALQIVCFKKPQELHSKLKKELLTFYGLPEKQSAE